MRVGCGDTLGIHWQPGSTSSLGLLCHPGWESKEALEGAVEPCSGSSALAVVWGGGSGSQSVWPSVQAGAWHAGAWRKSAAPWQPRLGMCRAGPGMQGCGPRALPGCRDPPCATTTPFSNKPNPNQISVNNVKASVVNGTGAPGQSPGAGRACESCYSKCLASTCPGQQDYGDTTSVPVVRRGSCGLAWRARLRWGCGCGV